MKLTIQNPDKIWGRQLYSKWIPGTYGWAARSVEEISDNYYFQLVSNGPIKQIQIKLRRTPSKFNPDDKVFLYELWASNFETGKMEQMWFSKQELDTMDGMCMRLGLMLEKILPKG
jgi:hypothetical protein